MKIEIDTERDSERELRAALHLLQSLLGYGQSRDRMPAAFGPGQEPSGGAGEPKQAGMFTMFDAPQPAEDATDNSGPPDEEPDIPPGDEDLRIEPY